jgi:hypothetical protein
MLSQAKKRKLYNIHQNFFVPKQKNIGGIGEEKSGINHKKVRHLYSIYTKT